MARRLKALRSCFWSETTCALLDAIDDDGVAITFLRTFGGQEGCHVPKEPTPEHPWVSVLGMAAFERVCAEFGGCRIAIPTASALRQLKWRVSEALMQNTASRREIARRFGCTERYVRMIAQLLREAGIDVSSPSEHQGEPTRDR